MVLLLVVLVLYNLAFYFLEIRDWPAVLAISPSGNWNRCRFTSLLAIGLLAGITHLVAPRAEASALLEPFVLLLLA